VPVVDLVRVDVPPARPPDTVQPSG
jgi:hypothetical protein